MTDEFPKAFKRFPPEKKEVKTFQELIRNFREWGGDRAPMTKKQTHALGKEARKLGIENTSLEVRFMRNNKQQIRYKDVVTGIWTRPDGTFSKKEGKKK
jgi:hypothetical protein